MTVERLFKKRCYRSDGNISLPMRIRAYHLDGNIYALIGLSVLGTLFLVLYVTAADNSGLYANLMLAIATSLMASVFVLAVDTVLKYNSHRSDIFLEGIKKLGISNLHFEKTQLLKWLLENSCNHSFSAVGYRCALTQSLSKTIAERAKYNVNIRFLLAPPWSAAYKLVYGDHEYVGRNYWLIFEAIREQYGPEDRDRIQVRFTERPFFNDTYIVDSTIVTGPYMHLTDPKNHTKLMAFDFFTYELDQRSLLYDRCKTEFEELWRDASEMLDWPTYCRHAQEAVDAYTDFRDADYLALLQRCKVPVNAKEVTA